MDGKMSESDPRFEVVIAYDERFEEQVQSGDPNPLTDFTIRVGGYDLTGATEDRYPIDDYIYFNLRKQLDAVQDVMDGKRRELTFYSVPDELVLDPSEDRVFVSLLKSSGEPRNDAVPEHGVAVSKTAFVSGLVDTAEEFHDRVVDVNENLRDSESMQELRNYIRTAQSASSDAERT